MNIKKRKCSLMPYIINKAIRLIYNLPRVRPHLRYVTTYTCANNVIAKLHSLRVSVRCNADNIQEYVAQRVRVMFGGITHVSSRMFPILLFRLHRSFMCPRIFGKGISVSGIIRVL